MTDTRGGRGREGGPRGEVSPKQRLAGSAVVAQGSPRQGSATSSSSCVSAVASEGGSVGVSSGEDAEGSEEDGVVREGPKSGVPNNGV